MAEEYPVDTDCRDSPMLCTISFAEMTGRIC